MCVWFAASEHCGVPRAPSGLLGNEEAGVSRAGTGVRASSWLPCSVTRSPAEEQRQKWLQFCSSPHFQFVLPSFEFLPHLQHALAAAAAAVVVCVCQPGELCGLFPGILSIFLSRLPAGLQCGHCGLIHPVPRRNASVRLLPTSLQLH